MLRLLIRVLIHAAVALLLTAVLAAGYAALRAWLWPDATFLAPLTSAIAALELTLFVGAPAVLVYWAPVYALLRARRLARWPFVLAGALPAALALAAPPGVGAHVLAAGLLVASITHAACAAEPTPGQRLR